MRTLRTLLLGICAITLIMGFNACSSDDDDEQIATYNLAFVDANKKDIILAHDFTEDSLLFINTDAPINALALKNVTAQTWCVAKLKDTKTIVIKAAANTENKDRTATFSIAAGETGKPIEFTVTQLAANTEYTLSIEGLTAGEYGTYMYNVSPDKPEALTITVKTNAGRWSSEIMYFGEDEDIWFAMDKASGRGGESFTVTFQPNPTTMLRNFSITLSAGNAEDIMITFMQDAAPATSLTLYDADWSNVIPNKTAQTFLKTDLSATSKKEFGVDANGSIRVAVCTSGTNTELAEGNSWLTASQSFGTLIVYPLSANSTGASRTLDVVIFGGSKELYRMPVTQGN